MKILMVSDVYKPVINGVTFSMEIAAEGLRQLGHEVTFLVPWLADCREEKGVYRLYSLPFPLYKEQRMALPWPGQVLQKLSGEPWDLVHLHTFFNAGFIGLWLAGKRKTPKIFTYHTLFEEYVHYIPLPQPWLRKLAAFWSRKFCNACHLVISPSHKIKEILEAYGVERPIRVLPTPIDPISFDAPAAQSPYAARLGLSPDCKICLYVGRLAKEKNLDFLLRAFRAIRAEEPSAHLAVVGDGPYRKALEGEVARLDLADSVSWAGTVPRRDLGSWYAHASVFLFASTTETQGMALSEALLFGLPAVIVDGPGTRDVMQDGENGFVTLEKERLFAQRGAEILRNPELRERLSHGALASVERLKAERIIADLVELYKSLLNHNGKRNQAPA